MDLGLKGKRALVMGASRGLGNGIARALAAEGCDLTIAARSEDKLEECARALRADYSVTVEPRRLDLGDPTSIDEMVGDGIGDRVRNRKSG